MRGSDSIILLSGVTALNTTSEAIPIAQFKTAGGSVVAAGTVTAGAVVYETAPTKTYSGTWSQAFSITPVTNANVTDAVGIAANFIRARIATAITGGATVTAYLNRSTQPLS